MLCWQRFLIYTNLQGVPASTGKPEGYCFMKEIKLTQGKVALVDDEDFKWLSYFKWFAHKYSNNRHRVIAYYKVARRKYASLYMHRLIMNAPDGLEIDHIDHNPLNNQKSNLRLVTHTENCLNRKRKKLTNSYSQGII